MISEYEHDLAVRKMLAMWRNEAEITQVDMGVYLGVSRRKIQMIEEGECHVKSFTIVKWAEVTGHDPILCMQQILYPESSFSGTNVERKRKMISAYLDTCREDELDALIEILLVDHGGNRHALPHLFASYVQLDLGDRQNITMLIVNCFKNRLRKKKLHFIPDLSIVSTSLEKAVEAHIKGRDRY